MEAPGSFSATVLYAPLLQPPPLWAALVSDKSLILQSAKADKSEAMLLETSSDSIKGGDQALYTVNPALSKTWTRPAKWFSERVLTFIVSLPLTRLKMPIKFSPLLSRPSLSTFALVYITFCLSWFYFLDFFYLFITCRWMRSDWVHRTKYWRWWNIDSYFRGKRGERSKTKDWKENIELYLLNQKLVHSVICTLRMNQWEISQCIVWFRATELVFKFFEKGIV